VLDLHACSGWWRRRRSAPTRWAAAWWVKTMTASGEGGCAFRCDNTTRRTVWHGDQALAEIRYPNGQGEQDTGLASANVAKAIRNARLSVGAPYGGPNTFELGAARAHAVHPRRRNGHAAGAA
jgi:hypothetical protein